MVASTYTTPSQDVQGLYPILTSKQDNLELHIIEHALSFTKLNVYFRVTSHALQMTHMNN